MNHGVLTCPEYFENVIMCFDMCIYSSMCLLRTILLRSCILLGTIVYNFFVNIYSVVKKIFLMSGFLFCKHM